MFKLKIFHYDCLAKLLNIKFLINAFSKAFNTDIDTHLDLFVKDTYIKVMEHMENY